MKVYDRVNKNLIEEKEYQKNGLRFLYHTCLGRVILKHIVEPEFSKKRGVYYNSEKSKRKIKPFVEKYNVEVSNWNIDEFKTFNEFFCRKKEINVSQNKNELLSVADSKLSCYKIDENLSLRVKNSEYDLEEMLESQEIAKKYKNGYCLVFRLCVNDYHRYIYVDSGKIKMNYKINGVLHTVRPVSEKYKVYSHNSREVSVLEMDNLGEITQIEVGALMVGAICNNDEVGHIFKKGEEKGYFEYGGSTIILLLQDNIEIDKDILEQSENGIETQVHIGEKIGKINE